MVAGKREVYMESSNCGRAAEGAALYPIAAQRPAKLARRVNAWREWNYFPVAQRRSIAFSMLNEVKLTF